MLLAAVAIAVAGVAGFSVRASAQETPPPADTPRVVEAPPPADTPRVVEAPPPADTPNVPENPPPHRTERTVPDSVHLNRDRLLETHFRVGVYAGYASNMHETSATLFTDGGECGAFSNGTGSGPAVGVFGEIPVVDDWLDAVIAVQFLQRGGTFGQVYTSGLPVLDPVTNLYVPLDRVHRYTADLGYVFIELGGKFSPLEEIPVYARVGGGVGFTATSPSHTQTEEIMSPEGVLYPETNTRIRNVSTGTIRDVGPHIAVSGALGYELPIGPRMTLAPEVSYYFPLNDVTPNYRWRVSALQVGGAMRWVFGKQYEFPREEPPVVKPPTPPEPEPPQVALAAARSEKIDIVETVVTETFPILPYVFFDSAAATVPTRYRQMGSGDVSSFSEAALPHRSLGAYYEVMNIIGSRLARTPSMKITLNGTTDGVEVATAAARELARTRAQSVKEYLVNTWSIDPKRITVTTSPQPTYPSSMIYAEGAEENRRVEIQSADGEVLRPILFERFNEYSIEPKEIPFTLHASSTTGIASWQMDVSAGDVPVKQWSGTGEPPPSLTWQLDHDAAADVSAHLRGDGTLRCDLRVLGSNGKSSRASFEQPARKELNPFEVSRLSLIVFDFDKAAINTQNQQMISSFVSKSMLPSSTATIVGSTDRLGELAHNEELSIARAEAVRDLVVREQPKANITKVEGIGPSRLLYDNDTPEGRYYCRTVQVEVKTPIEDIRRQ